MPRRRPDTQLARRRRKRVGENHSTLLGQPQRGFGLPTPVVQGDDPSRKLAAGLNRFQLALWNIVTKEESWTECSDIVVPHEQINVPNVIRFENNRYGWWMFREPVPNLYRTGRRYLRVQHQYLTSRLDAGSTP